MQAPPKPLDEAERIRELQCLQILDTGVEERFDRITRVAQRLFQTPIALVSLVDSERQWFKSRQGLEATETPRALSFCGYSILSDETFVVSDAWADPRFQGNPLVTGAPHVRFYAGAPLKGPNGYRVGSLCIIDHVPRNLSNAERAVLRDLADIAENELSNVRLTQALNTIEAEMEKRIAAQRGLEEFARRERELVTTVAHELRTPLTSIQGALGLLVSQAARAEPTPASKMLEIALRNASRLSALVDDFLDMERITNNRMTFDLRPQPLLPLIQRSLEDNAGFALSHGTSFELKEANARLMVNVDESHLLQIMSNLLSNAAKFSPPGRPVEIALRDTGERVRIEVRDHGPGIPPAFSKQIFQRFARADSADNRSKGGTGLGLAISKAMVESMGGTIRYELPPDGGTRMIVELPRHGFMQESMAAAAAKA